MKKLLICGMLLGLLSSVSFAQRGRSVAGVGPSANTTGISGMPSHTPFNPNAVGVNHGGVMPNARTVGSQPSTVPSSATRSNTTAIPSSTRTAPSKVTGPDARTVNPDTGLGPDR